MTGTTRRVFHQLLLCTLTLVFLGCTQLTRDAKSPVAPPQKETARIFFALDQGYPSGFAFISKGTELLGFLKNGQHFVVDLPAGEHLLILTSAQDEAISGTFEAGKTYHVRLHVTPGVMSTRTYWTPLENEGEDLKLRREIVDETDRVELIPEEKKKWEEEEKDDLIEREKSFRTGEDEIDHTIGPEHAL